MLPPGYPDDRPRLFRLEGDDPVEETPVPDKLLEVPGSVTSTAPDVAPPEVPQTRKPDRVDAIAATPATRFESQATRLVATDRAWLDTTSSDGGVFRARRVDHDDGARTYVLDPRFGETRLKFRRDGEAVRVTDDTDTSVEIRTVRLTTDLASRSAGIVDSGHLRSCRVLVIGCGSVGSPMAVQLVRAGIGALTLVDPDEVSVANLARSEFELADVGRSKVHALAERCRRIHPHVDVTRIRADFTALPKAWRTAAGVEHDIAIVAVDQPDAMRMANAVFRRALPVVYPGVYEMGSGGEVLITRPMTPDGKRTACLECVLREIRFGKEPPPAVMRWDYSSADGRLKAEPALVGQIAHVVSAAVMITLGLLSEHTDTTMGKLVNRRYSAVFLANDVGWIFEHPLQAVWAELEVDPDCACGAEVRSEE